MTSALFIDHITRSFATPHGPVLALDEFTLQLEPGETCALVGPSGCGKTTALNIIAGLDAPSSGHVFINGHLVEGPGAERGMVFQNDCLFPWLTVRDNGRYGLRLKSGRKSRGDMATVDHLLERVGLAAYRDYHPGTLSGGMRQRAALVRALATKPAILLMDEPFAALDAPTRESMQTLVDEITSEMAITVVMVTHDLEEAVFMADRVVVLQGRPGRLAEDLAIAEPRPRQAAFRLSPTIQDHRRRLAPLLHGDTAAAHPPSGPADPAAP